MPSYTFQCTKCDESMTQEFERGKAPRELPCKCGACMERVINVRSAANVSKKEPASRGDKLRENLKEREDKLTKSDKPDAVQRYKSWSRRMTGGKW